MIQAGMVLKVLLETRGSKVHEAYEARLAWSARKARKESEDLAVIRVNWECRVLQDRRERMVFKASQARLVSLAMMVTEGSVVSKGPKD